MRKVTISAEQRALAICLRINEKKSFREIARHCGISKSTAVRVCKRSFLVRTNKSRSASKDVKTKMGRPRKVKERDMRALVRNLRLARQKNANVTVESLVAESGMRTLASRRTFSRLLNEKGYGFFQARKKGLLTEKDRRQRLKYAQDMRDYAPSFWTDEVSFYLDGVSFVHKYNPLSTACSAHSRVWRKRSEGLTVTTKGCKDLAGGRRVHVIVAIAYGKGVILRVPYEKMNGQFFAAFIKEHFDICFTRSGLKNGGSRLFLMDNDPSQTSKVALAALQEIKAELHKIPPRSPDLNPIENIFHLAKSNLQRETISRNITSESFEQFQERVLLALDSVPIEIIDRTIASMPKRIKAVRESKGYRTKY